MDAFADPAFTRVVTGLLVVLAVATATGQMLRVRARTERSRATIANVNARIASWWLMSAVVIGSLLAGQTTPVVLFAVLSFLALREFITLTPTRRADHRVLLLTFFAAIPLQYLLVALGSYELFALVLPLSGVLAVLALLAIAGDTVRFTERAAQIYCGLILCVYAVSYTPALLTLETPDPRSGPKLFLFLIIVVESSDVLQYLWGKALGRRQIAAEVSPGKTWEGFIGGIATATLLGCVLAPLTPFSRWQAAVMSLSVTIAGFTGGLVMSAIKRDRGVKDFGTAIAGHGGVLDRIDSLCFAGPVFFHLARTFFVR